jgi:uncharacterized protein YciI
LLIDPAQPASEATMAAVFEALGRGRHWGLWIVETTPTSTWPDLSQGFPERFAQALRAHLEWLGQLESDGTLLLSGPVDQDLGLGRGLTVLRAASREDAAAIVADEPMARAGYRDNSISSWTVNEGSITVRVDLMANQLVL